MTLEEASKQFHISIEKLRFYEENGLLESCQSVNGILDYTESELRKAGMIYSLGTAGFDVAAIKQYLILEKAGGNHKEEKIQLLRKQRYWLLEEIHKKQQALDELDYMIDNIRKEMVME
ncbi:MAG: MerR family transcriptional regulator [Bacteroides sp.]|nr:MerR family transcriptional regulator [Bacteroides sp.]MCM1550083.1 MerR family transcriptional regulator [Clostridium sp.]